jgi:hypothetical protein
MTSDTLATALAFAKRDLAVFPVTWPVQENGRLVCSCGKHKRGAEPCPSPAKHPYGKFAPNGLLSATTESGIIKSWWGLNAGEANLAVATDRLVVVDLDPRHGSDESLAELDKAGLEWPHTWRSLTGGGGEHIIYAAPQGVEITSFAAEQMDDPPLGRGIDVRARGGYIVAPPSRHISGRSYCWSVDHHPADTPLTSAPDWLVEKLTAGRTAGNGAPREPVPAAEWKRIVTGSVTEYRDMAAAKIAGHLFRRGVDIDVVIAAVRGWNATYCVPPLADVEVMKILARIAHRETMRLNQERGQ